MNPEQARGIFEIAQDVGFQMEILDVGGGFISGPDFPVMAAALNDSLDRYFPVKDAVRIIYYKSKVKPHEANLEQDWQKIQAAALNKKQNERRRSVNFR